MRQLNFKITSFNEKGKRCKTASEMPAFYLLYCNNIKVSYFTTIEAAKNAAKELGAYLTEKSSKESTKTLAA